MRIGLIYHQFIPRGGLEGYLLEFCKRLCAAGHELHVVASEVSPLLSKHLGATIHQVPVIKGSPIVRMWQFERAVAGIGRACRELGVPVISGNVRLYNETEGKGILPTPTVGMVGLIDDAAYTGRAGFCDEGDVILLLGEAGGSLAGSEWLHVLHGKLGGRIPRVDLAREKALGELLRQGYQDGTLKSAHDVSEGGLAIALAECCLLGSGVGAQIKLDPIDRVDSLLFGEAPGRVVVTATAANARKLEKAATKAGVPTRKLGKVTGDHFEWKGLFQLSHGTLRDVHEGGLRAIVGS